MLRRNILKWYKVLNIVVYLVMKSLNLVDGWCSRFDLHSEISSIFSSSFFSWICDISTISLSWLPSLVDMFSFSIWIYFSSINGNWGKVKISVDSWTLISFPIFFWNKTNFLEISHLLRCKICDWLDRSIYIPYFV
jgi:hypothetical protein